MVDHGADPRLVVFIRRETRDDGSQEDERGPQYRTRKIERGERVDVVQITGLVARRLGCHPRVGEWLPRGARYGLIRFGSRTDVVLPVGSEPRVRRGARVRGGSSVVAVLPGDRT